GREAADKCWNDKGVGSGGLPLGGSHILLTWTSGSRPFAASPLTRTARQSRGALRPASAAGFVAGIASNVNQFRARKRARIMDGAQAHGGNFKSVLQQVAQREFGATPQYLVLDEKGSNIQAKQARRLGGRQGIPFPVSSIASGDVNAVAIGGADGAAKAKRHRMSRRDYSKFLVHVELPSRTWLARAAPQRADVQA